MQGSDTAVIMMSGHGSEELAVECMRNGAEDYISKPFALEDMLQRIETGSRTSPGTNRETAVAAGKRRLHSDALA